VDGGVEHLRALIRKAEHIQPTAQRLLDELNERLGKSAASDSEDQPDGRRPASHLTPNFM
jgi:hypothetical protein